MTDDAAEHPTNGHAEPAKSEVIATETRDLRTPFPAEELVAKARRLAEDIARDNAALGDAAAEVKRLKAEVEATQRQLETLLRDGTEIRPVEVDTVAYWEEGVAREVRRDTGELLRNRPLTERERQLSLDAEVAAVAEEAMVVHSAPDERVGV